MNPNSFSPDGPIMASSWSASSSCCSKWTVSPSPILYCCNCSQFRYSKLSRINTHGVRGNLEFYITKVQALLAWGYSHRFKNPEPQMVDIIRRRDCYLFGFGCVHCQEKVICSSGNIPPRRFLFDCVLRSAVVTVIAPSIKFSLSAKRWACLSLWQESQMLGSVMTWSWQTI